MTIERLIIVLEENQRADEELAKTIEYYKGRVSAFKFILDLLRG